MGEINNFTNSTLYVSNKSEEKVNARLVAPLIAAVGLVLIIVVIVAIQTVRRYRNRRRIYHVSDKVLKKGVIAKKQVIESVTAIQNDITEDEQVQTLHYEYSTEHLIPEGEVHYTSQPSINQNDAVISSASEPTKVECCKKESAQCREASAEQTFPKHEVSEEHFIPRANPLFLHLKKSNKIAPMVEDNSLASSITSGNTTEITNEELILIGTAIKSCPNFGRSPDCSIEYEQDEPCETLSYPALTQSKEMSYAKTSTSFQLQDISSASEISSAADNFYQLSADNLEDIPCTEAIAVSRKDLWLSQDVVSEDVIIIDN